MAIIQVWTGTEFDGRFAICAVPRESRETEALEGPFGVDAICIFVACLGMFVCAYSVCVRVVCVYCVCVYACAYVCVNTF